MLRRLAQPDAPRPFVFETRATRGAVEWLVGVKKSDQPVARRLFTDLLPGSRLRRLSASDRPSMGAVRRLRITGLRVPVDGAEPDEVSRALYAAFAGVRGSEEIRLQFVFGRGHAPRLLPTHLPDPTIGIIEALSTGTKRPASAQLARRLQAHAATTSLDVIIRIGVDAGHSARRQQLTLEVLGALRLLTSAGLQLQISPDSTRRFDRAALSLFGRLRLSTSELTPILGLPLGDADLPGMPAAPRRPLPPERIERKKLLFAVASAPGDEREIGIAPSDVLSHLVVTGPTRSGKSTVLAGLAEQWIRAERPIALLDPKRQLVDHLLDRLPRSAAGRVVVLDASDGGPVVGFNPLDTAGRNADVVVDGILASLRALFDEGWGPRTEDLMLAGLRSLSLSGERRGEPHTLIDLPTLLADSAFRRRVVGQIQDDQVLATFWSAFEEQSAQARAAMIAAPLNKLRKFLLRPNLVAVLGQARPTFRVRDLFRSDHALLVPLNDALVGPGAAQLLGSLLVAELFQATQERAAETKPETRPGLIVIDEAQRFVHLPTAIDDALATSRSYGVGWVAAHQYRRQFSDTLREGFDTNATTKLVFAPQPRDARDYAAMSRTLSADDFMALDQYELYATIAHEGKASPWFSARTLPPRPVEGESEYLRAVSRERFGAVPVVPTDHLTAPRDVPTRRKRRTT